MCVFTDEKETEEEGEDLASMMCEDGGKEKEVDRKAKREGRKGMLRRSLRRSRGAEVRKGVDCRERVKRKREKREERE